MSHQTCFSAIKAEEQNRSSKMILYAEML